MKRFIVTYLFPLVLVIALAACQQTASMPTAVAPTPTVVAPAATETAAPTAVLIDFSAPTEIPTPEPNESHWQVVGQYPLEHNPNLVGFLTPELGISVGYAGATFFTTDKAATWQKANNTSYCRFGLEIVNEQVAWSCGNAGHIRFTTDGGQTWQAAANFGGSEPAQCRHLSFLDATTGWAATPTLLSATADGAQTWQAITLPEGIGKIQAIFLRTASDGYMLDEYGTLYVTTDGGQTWQNKPLETNHGQSLHIAVHPVPIAAVRFTDAEHGVAVYQVKDDHSGWHAWASYTSDGGQTWSKEHLPSPSESVWSAYLSRDGQYLTLASSKNDIALYHYQP
jgi:photosystem II stability/assembly factor-like uncharacterized protein